MREQSWERLLYFSESARTIKVHVSARPRFGVCPRENSEEVIQPAARRLRLHLRPFLRDNQQSHANSRRCFRRKKTRQGLPLGRPKEAKKLSLVSDLLIFWGCSTTVINSMELQPQIIHFPRIHECDHGGLATERVWFYKMHLDFLRNSYSVDIQLIKRKTHVPPACA